MFHPERSMRAAGDGRQSRAKFARAVPVRDPPYTRVIAMWIAWTRDRRIDREPGLRRNRRSRPALEAMEGRQLLSTIAFDVDV